MPFNTQGPVFGGYYWHTQSPLPPPSSTFSIPPSYPGTPLTTYKPMDWNNLAFPPGFIPDTHVTSPTPQPSEHLVQRTPRTPPRVHILEVRYIVEDAPESYEIPIPNEHQIPNDVYSRIKLNKSSVHYGSTSPGRRSVRFAEMSEKGRIENGPCQVSPIQPSRKTEDFAIPLDRNSPIASPSPLRAPSLLSATDDESPLSPRLTVLKPIYSPGPSAHNVLSSPSHDEYLNTSTSNCLLSGTPVRPSNPLPTDFRFQVVQRLCPDSPHLSPINLPRDEIGANEARGEDSLYVNMDEALRPALHEDDKSEDTEALTEHMPPPSSISSIDTTSDGFGEENDEEVEEGEDEDNLTAEGGSNCQSMTSPGSSIPSPPLPVTPELPTQDVPNITIELPQEEVAPHTNSTTQPAGHFQELNERDEPREVIAIAAFEESCAPPSAPSTPSAYSPSFSTIPLRGTLRQQSGPSRPSPTSCPGPMAEDTEFDARLAELMNTCEALEDSAEEALDRILSSFLKVGHELNMVRHVHAFNRVKNALGKVTASRVALKCGLMEGLLHVEDEASHDSHFRYLCSLQRTLERLQNHAENIDGKPVDVMRLNKSYERLHQYEEKFTNLADKFDWLLERLKARELHEQLTQTSDVVRLQRRSLLEDVGRIAEAKAKQMLLATHTERTPNGRRASLIA